jgi:hypothetical protein
MANDVRISQAVAAASLDEFGTLIDTGGAGTIKIYADTIPTDADTAVGAQVLCATLTFNSTSFGAATDADPSVATANAITDDTSADATDTVTWFRIESGGAAKVLDGEVGTSGADINFNTVSFVSGATVSISALTLTQPLS